MENEKKAVKLSRKALFITSILLFCVVITAGQYATPLYASDDSVDVTVTVTSSLEESYGASVAVSSRVFLPQAALGEPDGSGARMRRGSWLSIELMGTITGCSDVSIWAAKSSKKSPALMCMSPLTATTGQRSGAVAAHPKVILGMTLAELLEM